MSQISGLSRACRFSLDFSVEYILAFRVLADDRYRAFGLEKICRRLRADERCSV
jgi:hypothetical protein